jgi:hypothetical protein
MLVKQNKVEQMAQTPGWDGYRVTSYGRVLSLFYNGAPKPRYLTPTLNSKGYQRVVLTEKGKSKSVFVHRLVAEAFLPNPLNLPVVNHINGNPLDNNVSNLEWCTYEENSRHAMYVLRRKGYPKKLSMVKAAEIRALRATSSAEEVARQYEIHVKTVRDVWNRKTWRYV